MFAAPSFSTGEKPQSKIWYHDGSYWAALKGPDGVALYEKTGTTWTRGASSDAILTTSGQCDVKWDGTTLFVLVYAPTNRLFEFSYDAAFHQWMRKPGFPVTLPNPAGSETMVLEEDSTGRLWAAVEGGNNINVYCSTSADHLQWTAVPVVLQTGVSPDDICSIVAFGGNCVGVFWSDQSRDEFGFRVHHDGDPPEQWTAKEIADAGPGHADDHIHLAFDSAGRVYAITKDASDRMHLHRRSTTGIWTTKTDVTGGDGTRGIVMVSDADAKVYILFTRWGVTPHRIEYRVADIDTLNFHGTTTFIASANDMNNVTGMKQILPPASLVAVAEDGGACWYDSFGAPPGGAPAPPTPPRDPSAALALAPLRVNVSWAPPVSGTPDGYQVYRSADGGTPQLLTAAPVTGTSFIDTAPPQAQLCYDIRAMHGGLESAPSPDACVDNTPPLPPGAPANATATLAGTVVRTVQLAWDAPSSGDAAASYDIDRSTDGGPFQRLNTLPLVARTFTDSALVQAGLCYVITAVSADGLRGPGSAPACVQVGAPPPAPPSGIVATLNAPGTAVMVRWTPDGAGTHAAAFNVYRSADGEPPVRLNSSPVWDHPALQFYVDSTLVRGMVCYQVAGTDGAGQEGAWSAPACLALLPPPPAEPQAALAEATAISGGVDGAAAWLFDDGAGPAALDATGHGHTAVLGATAAAETSDPIWTAGMSGNALAFDGVDDYASVRDSTDLDFAGSFTLEAWFRRATTGTADCILSKGNTQQRNYWMMLDATGHISFRWETSGGTNHGTATVVTVTDPNWHHVACVYDAALHQDRIYLDGRLVRQATDSGTPQIDADPIDIGARRSGGLMDFFAGSIDLVRVASGALYKTDFTPPLVLPGKAPRPAAHLAWETPATGNPAGYLVYRQEYGSPLVRITTVPVGTQSYLDRSAPLGALCYRVSAVDRYGQEGPMSAPLCLHLPATTPSDAAAIPARLALAAGPNPFNPSVRIDYWLPAPGDAALTIYDVHGARVATLLRGPQPTGAGVRTWNGKSDRGTPAASGIYFAVLRCGRATIARKVTLVR